MQPAYDRNPTVPAAAASAVGIARGSERAATALASLPLFLDMTATPARPGAALTYDKDIT